MSGKTAEDYADDYTEPELRARLKEEIKAGDRGGRPGQWSARKSQLLTSEYESQGGGYRHEGERTASQQHLAEWTEQDWHTVDGGARARDGDGTARYLPDAAWELLSDEEKRATDRKKRSGTAQHVANTEAAQQGAEGRRADRRPRPRGARARGRDGRRGAARPRRAGRGRPGQGPEYGAPGHRRAARGALGPQTQKPSWAVAASSSSSGPTTSMSRCPRVNTSRHGREKVGFFGWSPVSWRFHEQLMELQSARRDARARAVQAMYETSEARRQSRRYRELSLRDPLTGLYNRRHIDEQLARLLGPGSLPAAPLSVALVDLDHFKRFNDTFGHDVGDAVLRRVAELLQAAVPADGARALGGSFAARMGGEKFLMVLADTPPGDAAALAEDLRSAIAGRAWEDLTGDLPVTASIGVTTGTGSAEQTPAALLGRADALLYRAKDQGRDRVVTDAGQPRRSGRLDR